MTVLNADIPPVTVYGAKLRPPTLPANCLDRAQLAALISGPPAPRLVAITAAAGYGKSTLAVLGLQRVHEIYAGAQQAWLTLDEDDDDPVRFLAALNAVLAPIVPDAARRSQLAIYQTHARQAMLLLLAALDSLPGPLYLVLDDLHRIQSPEVHQLLSLMLERPPQSLHLILLSRQVLPLPLGRLRLRQEIVEIDEADLHLARSEAAAYIALDDRQLLDEATVDLLVQRTEGWIAGIQLILLSLRRHALGERRLPAHLRGDNRLLAEYLTSEVVAHQDQEMRNFLLECSILERLHFSLCVAVTGRPDSAQLLQRAVAERLFVRPLDASDEWFVFHHLFREMLGRELEKRRTHAQIDALHHAAAQWYAMQGEVTLALQHWLAGHAPELAAALVDREARPALLRNQHAQLAHWLSLLPAEQFDAHPRLLLDWAWMNVWRDQPIADLVRRVASILQVLDSAPIAWRDELTVLALLARVLNVELGGVHTDALAALDRLDPESHLARGWAYVTVALFDGEKPDPERFAYPERAVAEFAAARFEPGELYALSIQATLARLNADPSTIAICEQALRLFNSQNCPNPSDAAAIALIAGEHCFWQDRIEEAAAYFVQARNNAGIVDDIAQMLTAQEALRLCNVVAVRTLDVVEGGERPLPVSVTSQLDMQPTSSRANVVYWQILRWLVLDQPNEAWRAAQSLGVDLNTLTVESPVILWLAVLTAQVGSGNALRRLDNPFEALLAYYRQSRYRFVCIQLHLLLARQQQQLGRPNQARSALRRALHDVEQTGYVRTVLMHPSLAPLLRAERDPYALELAAEMGRARVAGQRVQFTEQERRILELLAQGFGIHEIAQQLVVSPATIKWHLGNIYRKLGVKGKREALARARAQGLLSQPL